MTEALLALVPRGRVLRGARTCSNSSSGLTRSAIEIAAWEVAPELVDWSPWTFAGPEETEERLRRAGFGSIRCWLQERLTEVEDVDAFVRTSILPAHLDRLPAQRRDTFAAAVVERVRVPLDYVRLNASARR